jgi:hypothetical protein
MIDFLKNSYNSCSNFTTQIVFGIIRSFNPFRGYYFPNNQGHINNVRDATIQQALDNANILDRAMIIRQRLADGTYNLIDLRLQPVSVRRLITNPEWLNQVINVREVSQMSTVTPDQLVPDFVNTNSPILEETLLSPQQEIVELSLDLNQFQQAFLDDTTNSSINSALEIVEKLL